MVGGRAVSRLPVSACKGVAPRLETESVYDTQGGLCPTISLKHNVGRTKRTQKGLTRRQRTERRVRITRVSVMVVRDKDTRVLEKRLKGHSAGSW